MTDNEIIKALKCCSDSNCHECPIEGCTDDIFRNALDLINRQKEKNESLKVDLAKCSIRLDNLYKTADEIKSEVIKEFAKQVKMAFYYEFDELIPSIMEDKIDNLVKEMTEVNENEMPDMRK